MPGFSKRRRKKRRNFVVGRRGLNWLWREGSNGSETGIKPSHAIANRAVGTRVNARREIMAGRDYRFHDPPRM
jgi:hypothetical protein